MKAHLRLRWEHGRDNIAEWICHYELVIPLTPDDIRRGDSNNDSLIITMGEPTKRVGYNAPCHDGKWDTPYRSGAHAEWDSIALKLPVYVMDLDGKLHKKPKG
jgi:hypothetical protein